MVWVDGRSGRLEIIIPKSGDGPSKCAIYGNFVR
jgi:hypothetical protein